MSIHLERDEFGGSFDPFDEFEDFDDSPDSEPLPNDPFLRNRHEEAEQLLDILADPSFQETLREFRLEDPRRLVRRNARRLRERALLLDPSRLMMGTMVRIAMFRDDFDGGTAIPAWIDERIDETIADLLVQDLEDERAGLPVKEPLQSRYAYLVRSLQIEAPRARRACILVNELPTSQRKVFFEIVCMLQPTRSLVEARLGKKKEITLLYEAALGTLERSGIGFRASNLSRGAGKPWDLSGGFDA